jgi:hypothetical protein
MKATYISLLVGGITTATIAAAAAAPDVDQLLACSRMQDTGARLQCFDRAVAPLARQALADTPAPAVKAQAPAATVQVPAATVRTTPGPAPAPAASRPEFGQEQLRREDQPAPSKESLSITARITSQRSAGQGTYLVSLDNGQVWRHETGSQAEYLKPGDAVTITRGSLGSYRLTRDAGKAMNWIKVTRIR